MDFQERLRDAIVEGRKNIEAARQADHSFSDGWSTTRQAVVRAVLEESRALINQGIGEVFIGNENGCTVLFVGEVDRRGDREYTLRFCADPTSRKVVCKTNLNLLDDESSDLEALTRERVEERVLAFVRAIFGLLEAQRSR